MVRMEGAKHSEELSSVPRTEQTLLLLLLAFRNHLPLSSQPQVSFGISCLPLLFLR